MNHSSNPNCKSVFINNNEETYALYDIFPGQEMTIDYRDFEEGPLGFEEKA
jgi:SET domain-containing protein